MTPSDLQALVDYNPETGLLTWKARPDNLRFNSKLSGRPAFAQMAKGYFTGRLGGKNYKAHRVAWAVHFGEWPAGQIDHINGVRTDNRLLNLRVVTNAENSKNQKRRSTNTSGEACVTWFARDRKWWVKINVDGWPKHVGFFDAFDDAVAARNIAWKEHGYHENHGR